jgi:hypothetical protein
VTELSERVQAAYAGSLGREDGWAATQEAWALLDRGQIRVAEKGEAGWIVHEWVKQAVLLWFRYAEMVVHDLPPFQFYDKAGKLLTDLSAREIDKLFADGTISGGMIPKVRNALDAANQAGCPATIASWRDPAAIETVE